VFRGQLLFWMNEVLPAKNAKRREKLNS
jgi:hypothetical protein